MRMSEKRLRALSLTGLLLVFLSGQFSLSRLSVVDLDVRYVLLVGTLPFLLTMLRYHSKSIIFSKLSGRFLLLLFLFTLYSAISMFWLMNIATGMPKLADVLFLFIISSSLLVVVHSFENRDELATIVSYFFVLMGLVYSSRIYWTAWMTGDFRGEVYTGGYNVQTRVLFISVCSSIFLFARSGKRRYLALVCLFLGGIVVLASKQGIVAAALVLALFLFLKMLNRFKNGGDHKERRSRAISSVRNFIGLVASALLGYFFVHDRLLRNLEYTVINLSNWYPVRLLQGVALAEIKDTRAQLLLYSLDAIKKHPWFGLGLAGYLDVPGIGFYPHNIALEFLLDGGIVSGVFFLMFAIYGIYTILKARESIYLPFAVIPLYFLIISFVSGGLYDFRYFFMWVIISLYLLSKQPRRKGKIDRIASTNTDLARERLHQSLDADPVHPLLLIKNAILDNRGQ